MIPFDDAFASQSAETYLCDFLVTKFHPHTIILGYDHRFGKNREGDYRMLERYAPEYRYTVKEISEKILHEVAVSSTLIREALLEGAISKANDLLGYDYFFEGTVVEGNRIGRTLGYPTANLEIQNPEKLIPGIGIYAVMVKLGFRYYMGMMSIGVRPTIKESDGRIFIEVNIFDFKQTIYHQTMRVYVKQFLRQEEKFKSLEDLKKQLALDKKEALRYLYD